MDVRVKADIIAAMRAFSTLAIASPRDIEKIDTSAIGRCGFAHIATGRTRAVFMSPTGLRVVKVPVTDYGYFDNATEVSLWRRGVVFPRWQLARCRLHKGTGFLVMDHVEPFLDMKMLLREYPWSGSIDCMQVGYDRRRQVVAYDYA